MRTADGDASAPRPETDDGDGPCPVAGGSVAQLPAVVGSPATHAASRRHGTCVAGPRGNRRHRVGQPRDGHREGPIRPSCRRRVGRASFLPQHCTVPAAASAHEWPSPAATATTALERPPDGRRAGPARGRAVSELAVVVRCPSTARAPALSAAQPCGRFPLPVDGRPTSNPLTATGTERLTAVPSPNWPSAPRPQHCAPPPYTESAAVGGAGDTPLPPRPTTAQRASNRASGRPIPQVGQSCWPPSTASAPPTGQRTRELAPGRHCRRRRR